MNTLVYCIEHEEMVAMEEVHLDEGDFCGHVVQFTISSDGGEVVGTDLDFCEFSLGYAYCPPPEVEPDWHLNAVEPGDEIFVEVNTLKDGVWTPELVEA